MTLALSVLSAVLALAVLALWLQWRARERGVNVVVEFLQERIRTLDAERETLLTRIQLWDAPKPGDRKAVVAAKPLSQPGDGSADENPVDEFEERIKKLGLRANSDGGYLDEYGNLFSTPEAFQEWVEYRDQNKLPVDADPRPHIFRGVRVR